MTAKEYNFDETDRKIISELQRDGRSGLVELGKRVGLTHPGVANRLKKLIGDDIVNIKAELNVKKLGMQIAVLGIEVDGLDRAMELSKKFGSCPRVAFIAPMTGDYNLIMILIGEDFTSLQHIIEKTIRPQPGVKRFSISVSSTPFEPKYLPIKVPLGRTKIAPCGKKCLECESFTSNLCQGCPSVIGYRGRL